MGSIGAAPMPPATQATVPRKSSVLAGNADVRRVAERAGDVREASPSVEGLGHLDRGLADRLDDEGDRSRLPVHVGDRQRDPLGARVGPHHDELARAVAPGHARRLDLEEADVFSQGLLDQDPEHVSHLAIPMVRFRDAPAGDANASVPPASRDESARESSNWGLARRVGPIAGSKPCPASPALPLDSERWMTSNAGASAYRP